MVGEGNGGGQDQAGQSGTPLEQGQSGQPVVSEQAGGIPNDPHMYDATNDRETQQTGQMSPADVAVKIQLDLRKEALGPEGANAPKHVLDALEGYATAPNSAPTGGVFEELTLPLVPGTGPEDRTVATYRTGPLVGGPEDPAATHPEMPAVRPGPASAQPDAPQPGNQGTSGSGPSGGTPGQS